MKKIVELKNAMIFQQKMLVLSRVNFSLDEGELIYLVGKTGSGKSSLLKTLYADLPLQQGEGMVCDFDLKKLKPSKIPFLRRNLGIIFQDFQLLTDRSALENLSFVMRATGWKDKDAMTRRMNEVMDMVALRGKGYKFPHELSGGEQQRVVIARALLNHPKLILADEPTGNLDPQTSKDILKLLVEISESSHTAVIVASHDVSTLQKFPARTVWVDEGSVAESTLADHII